MKRWRTRSDPLMRLWGIAIRVRDQDTCQRCGRRAPRWKLDAAHILSRGSAPRLKYELDNGILLCVLCHRWADSEGEAFRAWIEERWPGRIQRLRIAEKARGKLDREMARAALRAALPPKLRAAEKAERRSGYGKPIRGADGG